MNNYILLEDHSIQEVSIEMWADWYSSPKAQLLRRVAYDEIVVDDVTTILVSTVFIGIGSTGNDLFETMIFNGILNQYQERCGTWNEAIDMHEKAIQRLLNAYKGNQHVLECIYKSIKRLQPVQPSTEKETK